MSIDSGIGLVGIVVAVVLGIGGFLAAKVVKNRRQTQRQSVGANGRAIQSGRDTRIGN